MLVLARRINEKIVLNGDIVVTVLEVSRGQVRLGIEAPKSCRILRHELLVEVGAENRSAVAADDASAAAVRALFPGLSDAPKREPA